MNKPDRLYDLLPFVYRQRDAEQGHPLRALLRVIAEQVDVVESDIAQLYDNWFIETCEDWVVPYLGDLIGYRQVHEAGEPGDPRAAHAQTLNKILIPRREVAGTIAARRRKGTLALLEELAAAVAGWPARAVEFYKFLAWTQHLDHQRPQRGRTVDLRHRRVLARLNRPFDELAHTVDVRRINSRRTTGRYNIPSVGVFIWRLKPYSVSRTNAEANDWKSSAGWTPACCVEEEVASHCYTFSVLGNNTPLYNRPQRETDPTHIAGEQNLPGPILRTAFEDKAHRGQASRAYYGAGKSLAIWAPDWPKKDAAQPVPAEQIVSADLSHWRYHPRHDHVAVDPELGRIVFPPTQLPRRGVAVHYHYAFSADIGGGEYDRPLSQPTGHKLYRVGAQADFATISAALDQWTRENPKPRAVVIEITDSAVYGEPLSISLDGGQSLQIRAAPRTRPVIRLLDYMADRPDAFSISGGKGSRLTLDGLLVTGRGLRVSGPEPEAADARIRASATGDLCDVTIRHCTLVPGWGLHGDCEPRRATEPSIELINTSAKIKIEHSILGSIAVVANECATDPVRIAISDSIWDATDSQHYVLSGPEDGIAHARLTIARSTVIGEIHTHEIALAENSIFMGRIRVARRQRGCVRFCYVPPGSRTPRRYECQPGLVEKAVEERLPPGVQRDHAKETECTRVEPEFNSARYGTPAYCQLADTCAEEITRGADDESEMGVFHDLYQPQRAANLRARLDEFTPAGMDAGIIHAT